MGGNPQPLHLGDALQVDEARVAYQLVAQQRRKARAELTEATDTLADKERTYRKARATAYVIHAGAKSAGQRDALVDSETADERYDRDVAKGLVQACEERLREIDGERASLHRIVDWSTRLDPYATEGQSEGLRGPGRGGLREVA